MNGNLSIVVEGVDGTGKSSISKELAKSLNATYYRCPPKVMMPLRKCADGAPYLFRYLYYLIGNFIAQKEIRSFLKKTTVICDWYVFSTIAYHSVLLNKNLQLPNILMPDKLVYLSATRDQVKRRLEERQVKSKFEDLDFLEKVKLKYEELLSKYLTVLRIDTTNKTLDMAVIELLQMIK